VYPNIPSAIRPLPYGNGRPVLEPPDNFAMYSDDEDSVSSNSEEQQPSAPKAADNLPSTDLSNHKITEGELNDLIRDLKLPKAQHDCHHDMKVKPEAATAVIELLMMGGKTPETC